MARLFDEARDGWIRDAVREATAAWPGVRATAKFGCPCFQAGTAMFAVVANGALVLTRLTEAERAAARAEPFFTGAGRPPIGRWAQLRVGDPDDLAALAPLLRASYERALAEADAGAAAEGEGGGRKPAGRDQAPKPPRPRGRSHEKT